MYLNNDSTINKINVLNLFKSNDKFTNKDNGEECYTRSEVTLILIIFCLLWGVGILLAYQNGKTKSNVELSIYILLACPLNPFWYIMIFYHIGIVIGIRSSCSDNLDNGFLTGNCKNINIVKKIN